MRVRNLLVAGSALLLLAALAFVTVTVASGPGKRPEPVQQTGTAAGRPHRTTSNPHWTPPTADLDWNIPYQWKVVVTGTSSGVSGTTTVGPVDIEARVPRRSAARTRR